jgi:hypothetical protein
VYPKSVLEVFGPDWALNARGIYYRHYFSDDWITYGHRLYKPSLEGSDWSSPREASRRQRAKRLAQHALDNERWNKKKSAWEADAWHDVFGHMRDDPLVAA